MTDMQNESTWPPILGVSHMCQLLGIAESTLRAQRRRRSFPFTELPKFGRKPLWSRDAVLAAINGSRVTGRR